MIACAGSGKTESISRRVAALIEEGTTPRSIVAFTFTEKAALELKERIYQRVIDVKGEKFVSKLTPMFVGTIHSFCFQLLQEHVPKFGNYDILDSHRHMALISQNRKTLELGEIHSRHWKSLDLFMKACDAIGNELISPKTLVDTQIGVSYELYCDLLERYQLLTFSMIIAQTVKILQEDVKVFEKVQGALKHLIVDEYQDINPAQEKLIGLLAKDPVNLCVVGDDDQAIYQWRGSDVSNILTFDKRYKNVKTIRLETNRRSVPLIVTSTSAFAQLIPNRLEKEIEPQRETVENSVVPWLSHTPQDEAQTIAEHIVKLNVAGWRYQDIAVLYRSVRTSAPPLIQAFEQLEIPFNCGGRTGLFAHAEINAFGELYAWVADFSWRDHRFGTNRPAEVRQPVKTLLKHFQIAESKVDNFIYYFENWKKNNRIASGRVNLVSDFYEHLRMLNVNGIDPNTPRGSTHLGALARFSTILADYERVTLRGRWVGSEAGTRAFKRGRDRGRWFWIMLANYLVNYATQAYEDFEGEEIHNIDAVSVLTVHQSKGLEWPILFLPSLTNRRFPSSMAGRRQEWILPENAFPDNKRIRYEGGDADERRLFYVAATRARDMLYASSFTQMKRTVHPSEYLCELSSFAGRAGMAELDCLPLPDPPKDIKVPKKSSREVGFSDLADYEDCGFAYRLSRVFGFERELVSELGYGRALHHILRLVAEHSRLHGTPPNGKEIASIIDRSLYIPYANKSLFTNMKQRIGALVKRYLSEWPEDLSRIWGT